MECPKCGGERFTLVYKDKKERVVLGVMCEDCNGFTDATAIEKLLKVVLVIEDGEAFIPTPVAGISCHIQRGQVDE